MEEEMQELCIEGLANHDDPEPCAGTRELPRVSRIGNYRLIYAAVSIPRNSSMTSCGVLYPSVE
jgi:hypothetical protein